MSLLSVWMLELSLYTHGPLLRTMKFQLFSLYVRQCDSQCMPE